MFPQSLALHTSLWPRRRDSHYSFWIIVFFYYNQKFCFITFLLMHSCLKSKFRINVKMMAQGQVLSAMFGTWESQEKRQTSLLHAPLKRFSTYLRMIKCIFPWYRHPQNHQSMSKHCLMIFVLRTTTWRNLWDVLLASFVTNRSYHKAPVSIRHRKLFKKHILIPDRAVFRTVLLYLKPRDLDFRQLQIQRFLQQGFYCLSKYLFCY